MQEGWKCRLSYHGLVKFPHYCVVFDFSRLAYLVVRVARKIKSRLVLRKFNGVLSVVKIIKK